MFTFRAINGAKHQSTGKIMGLNLEPVGDHAAAFRAKLLRVFGEPAYTTEDAENSFSYTIEATDPQGSTLILTAYEGPSGPAIGGVHKIHGGNPELNMQAAEALVDLLAKAEPADFDAVVYYEDADTTIWYGYQNGKFYYREGAGDHTE